MFELLILGLALFVGLLVLKFTFWVLGAVLHLALFPVKILAGLLAVVFLLPLLALLMPVMVVAVIGLVLLVLGGIVAAFVGLVKVV